jgi:hypothetical protein
MFGCKPKKKHQCNAPMQCADFDFDLLTLTSMSQIMNMELGDLELGLRMSTNAAKFEIEAFPLNSSISAKLQKTASLYLRQGVETLLAAKFLLTFVFLVFSYIIVRFN